MGIKKKLGAGLFYDSFLNPLWRSSGRWEKVKDQCIRRDGGVCLLCGTKQFLEVHHICNAKHHKSLRFILSNLATLCKGCHRTKRYSFHRWHGSNRKKSTESDFEKWFVWAKKEISKKGYEGWFIPLLETINWILICILIFECSVILFFEMDGDLWVTLKKLLLL